MKSPTPTLTKYLSGFIILAVFLMFYSIIGTLEIKQIQKELAINNQQLQANTEIIQKNLKELKELYADLQDYTEAVSANVHDLRFRLNMTIPIDKPYDMK